MPTTIAGMAGRKPELAASSGVVESASFTSKGLDWRAIAELAGVEAAASLLAPFTVVFNTEPTFADLLALTKPDNSLPEGYARSVSDIAVKTRELTRRDYATYGNYDRAVAKGLHIKTWWEVTVTAALEDHRHANQLLRSVTAWASSSTNLASPSPLSTR